MAIMNQKVILQDLDMNKEDIPEYKKIWDSMILDTLINDDTEMLDIG